MGIAESKTLRSNGLLGGTRAEFRPTIDVKLILHQGKELQDEPKMNESENLIQLAERVLKLESEVEGLRKKIPVLQVGRVNVDLIDNETQGLRKGTMHVAFPEPFNAAPQLLVALSRIDAGDRYSTQGATTRLTLWTENVTQAGFDLGIATWEGSLVWQTDVSWVAYAPLDA